MEKESMKDSGENLNEEYPLNEISQLVDQVLVLLGQSMSTCTYVRRFIILMVCVNGKKSRNDDQEEFSIFY